MKEVIKNRVNRLLRKILENNESLESTTLLSVSKALVYSENVHLYSPKGKFYFSTKTKEVESGNNETGATYRIVITNKGINMSSSHYFSEAFGLSHESHQEILWPEEYTTIENLNECFDSWEANFFQGLADHKCVENLTGMNPRKLK